MGEGPQADAQYEAEWRRPEAWRGGWLGLYYNPRDPRLYVPKRGGPFWGQTLNFAHRTSWYLLGGLLVTPTALLLFAWWVTCAR